MNANFRILTDEYQLMTPFDSNFQSAHFLGVLRKFLQCSLRPKFVRVRICRGAARMPVTTGIKYPYELKKTSAGLQNTGRTQLLIALG